MRAGEILLSFLSTPSNITIMRKRINRAAICSSENYAASKKLHKQMLNEKHSHFSYLSTTGEVSIDQPILVNRKPVQRYKTIRIFGKEMKLTIEEYREHSTLK